MLVIQIWASEAHVPPSIILIIGLIIESWWGEIVFCPKRRYIIVFFYRKQKLQSKYFISSHTNRWQSFFLRSVISIWTDSIEWKCLVYFLNILKSLKMTSNFPDNPTHIKILSQTRGHAQFWDKPCRLCITWFRGQFAFFFSLPYGIQICKWCNRSCRQENVSERRKNTQI